MSSAPLSWPPSVPRPTTRPRSNTVASCDGPPVSGSMPPFSDAPAPTPLPLSWPITLLLWAAGASAPRSVSRPLLHANACWTYPSQKGAQCETGRSGSAVIVSAVPITVPLLVIDPGRVRKLPGPPNVPGSTSLYGYCVRACAGAAKVSAGRIAAAISAARRLLMILVLSRWLVWFEATELRRRSHRMRSRSLTWIAPAWAESPMEGLQLLHRAVLFSGLDRRRTVAHRFLDLRAPGRH